ncbi:MAG: DNA translocase FtsK [Clostridia bacterium]|nr:DNA translocase FtsK [Clostridia bacterium]
MLGHLMMCAFDKAGSLVLIFSVMFILVLYVFGITPRGLWIYVRYKAKVSRERKAEQDAKRLDDRRRIDEEREKYLRDREAERELRRAEAAEDVEYSEPRRYRIKKNRAFIPDIPIDGEDEAEAVPAASAEAESPEEIDERIFDEAMRRTKARRAAEEKASADSADPDETELGEIPDQLPLTEISDGEDEVKETVTPVADVAAEKADSDKSERVDLKKIFVNPEDAELLDRLADAYLNGDTEALKSGSEETEDDLTITRVGLGDVTDVADEAPAPPVKQYEFPDINILTEDTSVRDENIKEELHANAVKLVETLKSFNVKTKIENVSRGPTITRYELLPEAGIRVRSILNLVDDIALNLATTGVRIEAPIPGKPAVGIEVPNKNRATVHLRTLIEDERFANAQSSLLCALGKDVGGENVYLDIAKMPHLLIAGATGMGKSVCINSLIVSLLYNADPDEVKLILIDPKKVELNVYNGLPHLLVPVVSDPKKAAGSLSWAVSEMERRFGLIESVGVRDINAYNRVTANDPAHEFMPYIVIIIDELADLMMTAPDDVEESVCRLMQKARAAGMHVIIGTQRPSVDVITGLIKANIPSRIACTVASQVDSRTIIDRAGAESLIGRGDMLYLPVGASKPIRVQGAYVSEDDVEEVVTFIKTANAETKVEYSNEVIDQIEKAAAMCGAPKKGGGTVTSGDASGEDDPMLRQALELAVNSGKISTSLIQRRLSLGYGRAAKLIDKMEQMGYVSPPEGQKPRDVLITKEQFMEMVLKEDGDIV